MKKKLRGVYLLISSLIISVLHVPLALAKTAAGQYRSFFEPGNSAVKTPAPSPSPIPFVKSVYDSLHLNISGLSKQAYDYARRGFERLIEEGKVLNDSILSIIDFSESSDKKRLYILDLKNYRVLFNTWVAHGKNSGREFATSFSNQFSSYKSSPGFYVTAETYLGNNGYSLKLEGLERGINDNAYDRSIVMHGAGYVDPSYIQAQGFIGRSEGCPAIPRNLSAPIINTIKDGTCMFIYHPSYIRKSTVLN